MIYTCIIGSGDKLTEPLVPGDYTALMDKDPKVSGWKYKKATKLFIDKTRNARMHKILMPKETCLWIDGNILPTVKYEELLRFIEGYDICVHKHPNRSSVYEEAAAIINYGLDDAEIVTEQIDRYKKEKYPEHTGMVETGVILRRDTPKVREFNRLWWEEICRGSKRDQLSFNYCIWKSGIQVTYFPDDIVKSELFTYKNHIK